MGQSVPPALLPASANKVSAGLPELSPGYFSGCVLETQALFATKGDVPSPGSPTARKVGKERGQGLGDRSPSETLELRYMVVAPEEDVAQPRRAKSCGPSGTHIAPVPSVDEETGTDLPHDEEGGGTSLPCKHTFSGWQAETCPCSNPHPVHSSTFLPTTQQKPSPVLGITPQCPAYGLPLPCRSPGDQKSHPKAAQHFELQNLVQRRGPNLQQGQRLTPTGRASGSVVSWLQPRVASIITQ